MGVNILNVKMVAKKINFCRKGKSQYEITISGGEEGEYGMPGEPPIVTCAKNKKSAVKQFKFPKGIKVRNVKRVS